MARNPKDLVVSYYQFHRSLRTMSYRGTFQEFCRRFMNDKCKCVHLCHRPRPHRLPLLVLCPPCPEAPHNHAGWACFPANGRRSRGGGGAHQGGAGVRRTRLQLRTPSHPRQWGSEKLPARSIPLPAGILSRANGGPESSAVRDRGPSEGCGFAWEPRGHLAPWRMGQADLGPQPLAA